jgi:hypothetical protein
MIRAVCHSRKTRGHGWFDPQFPVGDAQRDASRRWVCSLTCLSEVNAMTGPNNPWLEQPVLERLRRCAGEYIESVGKTDLMLWSPEEFRDLLEVVVKAYQDSDLEFIDDDIPF